MFVIPFPVCVYATIHYEERQQMEIFTAIYMVISAIFQTFQETFLKIIELAPPIIFQSEAD